MRPLIVGGQRGAAVFIRPNVESMGEDIARRARGDMLLRDSIVYLTCLHELGHALGLVHTRDFRDIMYYFGYGGDDIPDFQLPLGRIHPTQTGAPARLVSGLEAKRTKALQNRETFCLTAPFLTISR